LAAEHNPNPDVLAILVTSGARVNARNQAGMTPLMFAAQMTRCPREITMLLGAGADPSMKNGKGETAYMLAGGNESLRASEVLGALAHTAH
jgi:ankyrin repeat protein